ncbi:MAG: ATP-dependent zinc metalloprotease FtsH [Alphaproteobacteria bacterium]|nr:ATP-dependent zinc metalloprotease FtsH [Alphaproteobacteria bacterium]
MKKVKINDKSSWFLILFAVLFVALIARTFVGRNSADVMLNPDGATPVVVSDKPVVLSFSDVLRRAGDIKNVTVRGTDATGVLKDGTKFTATVNSDTDFLKTLSDKGATVSIDASRGTMDMLGTWLPILFSVLFIVWLFRGLRGGAGGLNRTLLAQNPTKVTTGKPKTTFADVAGIDSEKQELMEIVEFLKNKDKFRALGARVPRGVLLSGEPGTGKTLLARAIAGEANVPFFATSGSDFSGIIVGLGVAKIKEMFEMAKRNAPCILFIDEIDAIGQKRSSHSINDQDREQTLNQLLIEMDGFANETGIIVIGATNRPDMLDAALLRPGRFDRQVQIELPDLSGRDAILQLHAKKFKISNDVDMHNVARGTTGFSGADLENLLNEGALHAVRAGHKSVEQSDLDEARDKILMGPKKNRKMRPDDIKLAAHHEAGHAFVSMMYADVTDPILKATIIPRGRALGMVQHLPVDDKVSMTVAEVRANLAVSLAGRAAEQIFFGADKITTGAESDIDQATRLVRYAVATAGLSPKLGLVAVKQVTSFGTRSQLETASEKTAELVDAEVRSWLDVAYADAVKILTKNKKTVARLADELLKRETLTGDEIREIIFGKKSAKSVKKSDVSGKGAKRVSSGRKKSKKTAD